MNKVTWKFPLVMTAEPTGNLMPVGAVITHVGLDPQRGTNRIAIWALVDPAAIVEERKFEIDGTGDWMRDNGVNRNHVGTVIFAESAIVFHVFEVMS